MYVKCSYNTVLRAFKYYCIRRIEKYELRGVRPRSKSDRTETLTADTTSKSKIKPKNTDWGKISEDRSLRQQKYQHQQTEYGLSCEVGLQ